jgi:hypothetical protein
MIYCFELNVLGLEATVRFETRLFSYAGSPVRLVQLVLCNDSTRNSNNSQLRSLQE